MRKNYLLGLVLLMGISAQAVTPPPKLDVYFSNASFWGLDWCKETWTGSDAPFLNIKRDLSRQVAQGQSWINLAATYKEPAQRAPQNAEAQFRYAYAVWQASRTIWDGQKIPPFLSKPLQALERPASPRSYQYTRLHWLLEHRAGIRKGRMPMIGLGKRLIVRNPKDHVVRYFLVEELVLSDVKADVTDEAVFYARQMAKDSPNNAATYSLLGDVLSNASFLAHAPVLADQALASYNRYLRMTPPNYFPQYRLLVKGNIEDVKKLKIRFTREKQK